MNRKDLYRSFNEVDDEVLERSEAAQKMRKSSAWIKWMASAACLCLVAGLALRIVFPAKPRNPAESSSDLPMLTLPEDAGGGMGYEGYMAHDVSELVSGSPWTEEANLTTLPVFENPKATDRVGKPEDSADTNDLHAILVDTAARLGIAESELVITDNGVSEQERQEILDKYQQVGDNPPPDSFFAPTAVIGTAEGITIRAERTLGIEISFEPALSLPDTLTFAEYEASYQNMESVAAWLSEEYASLLNMEKPAAAICGGDCNIYGQRSYQVGLYEGAGSIEAQLIAYHFKRADFVFDAEGRLWFIRLPQPDLTHVVGDYPLVTPEQAESLLIEGHYVTSVPYEMPGQNYIARVELCYRNDPWNSIFLPYYRFLVELPEEKYEDRKTYGIYYVPAVEGRYLSNMPLWDGSIN